jgi:hypothetical protein
LRRPRRVRPTGAASGRAPNHAVRRRCSRPSAITWLAAETASRVRGDASLRLRISRAVSRRVAVGSPGDRLRRVGDAARRCEAAIQRHWTGRLPPVLGVAALDLLPAGLDRHLGGCFLKLPFELRQLLLDGSRFAGRLQLANRLQHLTEPQNVVCAHLALRSFLLHRRQARAPGGFARPSRTSTAAPGQVYIAHGVAGQIGRDSHPGTHGTPGRLLQEVYIGETARKPRRRSVRAWALPLSRQSPRPSACRIAPAPPKSPSRSTWTG